MTSQDRRGSFRLDVSVSPAARLLGIDTSGSWPLSGVLRDLSADGAQLAVLRSQLQVGQHVRVSFVLDDQQYHVAAEVRWVRGSRGGLGQSVGVRFEKLLAAEKTRIVARIAAEQRRQMQSSRAAR